MNIIDERDVRTIYRKIKKKEYDDIITLSASSGHTVRLLDEGAVVTGNGTIDFYIMKGTLEKYVDSIPDDYEGSINLGHMDFASFPILLGKWTKKDLKLVDIGGGRKGLDVTMHLDEQNMLVKEMKRQGIDLGVSAEFTYKRDEKATDEYGILMINELFIWDFAIVGDAGNVNSMGIQLKGDKMDIKKVLSLLKGDDIEELSNAIDAALEETPEEPEKPEEKPEEEEQVEETPEEPEEKPEEEEVEETPEEPEEPEVTLAAVMEAVNSLTEKVESLEAENADLTAKLSAQKQKETDFLEKFKKLGVALSTQREEPVVDNEVSFTDGFGG